MSWELARVVLVCHRCTNTIGLQQPARRGDIASTLTWCESCAGIEFDEVPPADLSASVVVSKPMVGHGFTRPTPSPALRVVARDGRQLATGERE